MNQNQLTSQISEALIHEALVQSDLINLCDDYSKLTKEIDTELAGLNVNLDKLNSVAKDYEELVSAEAAAIALEEQSTPDKRFSTAGDTRLRWLLDGEGNPVFEKLDVEIADRYRRRLMQYYHPDRETGDEVKFQLVKTAAETANVEMLALMILGIGHKIELADLKRYHGAAFRRLAKLKAGLSFKALCLCKTGNREMAQVIVQNEVDKRASLIQVAILTKGRAK
jgi:hypothetical protein